MTIHHTSARRFAAVAVAAALALSACGGDDASVTTAAGGDTTAVPESTIAPETSAAPETTVAPETSAAPETTVAPETEFADLVFTPQSAGPLSVSASECTVDGIAVESSDSWDSMALSATHLFVPAEGGVAALAFTPGVGCAASLDTTVGADGLLATADPIDSVSASADNIVAASGVFSTTVFNVGLGQSYSCSDATGYVTIAPEGDRIVTTFPGSPVEQFGLSDTTCTPAGEIPLPAELAELYFFGFAGSDYYMGGKGPDDTVYAALVSGGATAWKVGNAEVSGAGWMGWVHGMAPCAGGHCIVDTNTDKLIVTDAAGVLRAEFAISDLIGQRHFYHSLLVGPDAALYLLTSDRGDDGSGGSKYANHIVRLDITG